MDLVDAFFKVTIWPFSLSSIFQTDIMNAVFIWFPLTKNLSCPVETMGWTWLTRCCRDKTQIRYFLLQLFQKIFDIFLETIALYWFWLVVTRQISLFFLQLSIDTNSNWQTEKSVEFWQVKACGFQRQQSQISCFNELPLFGLFSYLKRRRKEDKSLQQKGTNKEWG